jgi:hypothetical protein
VIEQSRQLALFPKLIVARSAVMLCSSALCIRFDVGFGSAGQALDHPARVVGDGLVERDADAEHLEDVDGAAAQHRRP